MELVKSGKIFALPDGQTAIDGLGTDFRTKQEDCAGSHGSVETGDGKATKKIITIDVHIFGRSIADHDYQYDALMSALSRQDQQLFIRPDRYLNLARMDKVTRNHLGGHQFTWSQVTASLIATDPFWYAVAPVSQSSAITASPTSIIINNPGNIDTPLTVSIAASADCSAVTVTNKTDSNRKFALADVQLVSGQAAVINAALGTVYRGTSNTINTFSGSFLSLLPGENTITYTGGNCTLTLAYTPRWL